MAQFLCLKNIRTFLATCTTVFELRETDLFQASMLYDYTDFARVLHTLSRLSNCAKVTSSRPQVQGFPRSTPANTANAKHRNLSGSVLPRSAAHVRSLSPSVDQSGTTACKQVRSCNYY